MSTKKDLLLLLLDVGEHMQPYLPLLHRLVYNVLTTKLICKPRHEVAVVLYGTEGTRHKLYSAEDPAYLNVTVLRPLQNLDSYQALAPFAFASDPPAPTDNEPATANDISVLEDGPEGRQGPHLGPSDPKAAAAAEAALFARVEAAGLAGAGGDPAGAAAAVARAARLFGRPAGRSDWADGLVVALDLLATAISERFEKGCPEANKLGAVRLLLVSNLLAESVPFDDDFRSTLVDNCNARKIAVEVACLDHYVASPYQQESGDDANNGDPHPTVDEDAATALSRLPEALAAARRHNLEQLHLLKSELAPAMFSHLRQPGELLCLSRAKEVMLTATNATFKLAPDPESGTETDDAPGPLHIAVKLYKKIRRAAVEEWRTVMDVAGSQGGEAGAAGGGGGDGGGGATGSSQDPGPAFVREVEYEDPVSGEKFAAGEFVVRGYAYGKQLVPVMQYDEEQGVTVTDPQVARFYEKGLSLLGFIDANGVPHHRLGSEPYVMVGDSPSSAVAVAALALVLQEGHQAGVVRCILRSEAPRLALLTPHLSDSTDVPHALLLSPLPFAEDIRTHAFSTFRNEAEARDLPRRLAEARGEAPPPSPPQAEEEDAAAAAAGAGAVLSASEGPLSGLLLGGRGAPEPPALRYEKLQPSQEQQDAALALVRALDLGPAATSVAIPGGGREPVPEALAPDATANPVLQRMYSLVTSRAVDPTAQLPHPEDDPLVQLVLQPHGRYWPPGAREVVRVAEEKLRTRERPRGEGPEAKRARRLTDARPADEAAAAREGERGGEGGGGAAGAPAGPAAAAAVVFDSTAAGGTSGRVSHVRELTAVEDFRAMLRQGRESAVDAVRQLQELVRKLVERSIGDQLYDKALQCIQALRDGCITMGHAGGFNTFFRDLVAGCKANDRGPFVALLAYRRTGLITADQLASAPRAAGADGGADASLFEDDGGGVDPAEARAFLDEQGAAAEGAVDEATLSAVVADEEFDDMD